MTQEGKHQAYSAGFQQEAHKCQ
ncbi:uncharacterized protein METZ01_LOCUS252668 [marine metagenome]|uniref:Uncharacterized protein n=1 Tax=marine metagenome TaxID=408172 RepID=A0A382IJ73_9ZZZZ